MTLLSSRNIALILLSTTLGGCCLFPSKTQPGINRDKVATEVTELVRGMRWETLRGTKACSADADHQLKELAPLWVQITVSLLSQDTSELNPSGTTPVPIGIVTPTLGYDVKNQHGIQTDTVLVIDKLPEWKTWPKITNQTRLKEAGMLSDLIEKAESDVVTGGDSEKPCLGVSTIAISTILDLTQTVNGEIKIGIGPFAVADLKANVSKESKATMKLEIHYSGTPPAVKEQLFELLQHQMSLMQK